MAAAWIPLGYMLKHVAPAPSWLGAPGVKDICAVSGCLSEPFADFARYWRHNGHWLFDTPGVLIELAAVEGAELAEHTLFYYEAWPHEYDEPSGAWRPPPAPGLPVQVQPPPASRLLGFDVVTWSMGAGPECSPLSCNGMAAELRANAHCLFDRHEQALQALELGRFDNSEPGPFRVVAVHEVQSFT